MSRMSKELAKKLAENDWSEEETARIMEKHDKDLDGFLGSLNEEKDRQMALLRQRLARRRQQKESELGDAHNNQVRYEGVVCHAVSKRCVLLVIVGQTRQYGCV